MTKIEVDPYEWSTADSIIEVALARLCTQLSVDTIPSIRDQVHSLYSKVQRGELVLRHEHDIGDPDVQKVAEFLNQAPGILSVASKLAAAHVNNSAQLLTAGNDLVHRLKGRQDDLEIQLTRLDDTIGTLQGLIPAQTMQEKDPGGHDPVDWHEFNSVLDLLGDLLLLLTGDVLADDRRNYYIDAAQAFYRAHRTRLPQYYSRDIPESLVCVPHSKYRCRICDPDEGPQNKIEAAEEKIEPVEDVTLRVTCPACEASSSKTNPLRQCTLCHGDHEISRVEAQVFEKLDGDARALFFPAPRG